jgi:histone-lysine N-methyltransferase SETMAR
MDKIEYRAVIKFFVKGLTPNEIHSRFIKVYGDFSSSFLTIKKWAAEFKRGRTSLEDDPREGVQKVQHHQRSLNKCTIWYWMTGI